MYRQTSPQLTLLEPAVLVPGILPDDDWSFTYKMKVWPFIDEGLFEHLYEKKGGAPNISIKLKMSLLIFMALEELTWREVEFMYMRRIDWMNATHTDFGNAFIDHTTLFKFYQQLEQDDVTYKLFIDLTERFVNECNVSTKKQRVDSFFMLGWLATLSRYGLFKETIRVFLQILRKHKPGLYKDIKEELSIDYLRDNFDLTEKDKDKTRGRIKEMAKDLHLLKSAFENHNQVKHYETFNVLIQVFEQQCMIKPKSDDKDSSNKDGIEIEIREKPEGDKIISSPHNTDANYTKKRNKAVVGHKGFVTETCDTENDVQFLTDVNLEAATHADANEIAPIEARLEENNLKPEILYGDAGFTNGKSILESEEKGIDLAGPSSGRSQSFEGFADSNRPLDFADFQIEIHEETGELTLLSCPEGNQPCDQSRSIKTGKILVHYKSEVCSTCPSCKRCPVKIGVNIATLTVDEAQHAGAVRHHKYMGNVEYRKECGIRAGAESLVNEIANSHDGRQARHRTEKGARLQLFLAGISCNVKRYMQFIQQKSVQNMVNVTI